MIPWKTGLMKIPARLLITLFSLSFMLTGCSFNPFSTNNHTTGSPTGALIGAGVGVGTTAALGASKPVMVLAGIAGGAVGYYVTTLRFQAGGIYQSGGQVYQVGKLVGIYIPSDKLFEPNTADFLPQAEPILESVATILERYPEENILISGNTSGFGAPRWEQRLSQLRAQRVAAFLWKEGITQTIEGTYRTRRLHYVGYGNYFPLSANDYTNENLRENSRIQITVYPPNCSLYPGYKEKMGNIGSTYDGPSSQTASIHPCSNGNVGC